MSGLVGSLNRSLSGQPDEVLTALLIGLAVLAVVAALAAPPALKAAIVIWYVVP